jgi:phosphinothricin acetyltransferase
VASNEEFTSTTFSVPSVVLILTIEGVIGVPGPPGSPMNAGHFGLDGISQTLCRDPEGTQIMRGPGQLSHSDNRAVVRHADPERDGEGCAAVYAPYVRDHVASFEEVAPDGAEMARRIAETTRTHPWLVLERDGRVVGFAYGCPHRARRAYRWAAEVSVYVDAAEHGSGAGRALYAPLLELLRRQGLYRVCAGITLPNPRSVALHEAFGFTPVGVYRSIGYKAGAWHDVGWWELALRPADDAPSEPLGPQRLADLA